MQPVPIEVDPIYTEIWNILKNHYNNQNEVELEEQEDKAWKILLQENESNQINYERYYIVNNIKYKELLSVNNETKETTLTKVEFHNNIPIIIKRILKDNQLITIIKYLNNQGQNELFYQVKIMLLMKVVSL